MAQFLRKLMEMMNFNKIMNKHLNRLISLILFLFLGFFTSTSYAQKANLYGNVRSALKAGNSKELAKYFHETIELNINGETENFSKIHAEIYLKDFFKKYESVDFDYVHQGSYPDGLRFAIGSYTYSTGNFTIIIRSKKFSEEEKIYIMDIRKEKE